MNNSRNYSGNRQLGLEVEGRVVDVMNHHHILARHADSQEDLSGWDVQIVLGGFTVWIDLTISCERLRQKLSAEPVCNGSVIAVLVDPRWSDEEMFREILRQVVYSLPERVKRALLKELA